MSSAKDIQTAKKHLIQAKLALDKGDNHDLILLDILENIEHTHRRLAFLPRSVETKRSVSKDSSCVSARNRFKRKHGFYPPVLTKAKLKEFRNKTNFGSEFQEQYVSDVCDYYRRHQ